jgi:hypothetical protein
VFALTLADFALWHWSLGANRDVLALVSGLTLPPLFAALVWLLAVNIARVLALGARRPAARLRTQTVRAMRRQASPQQASATGSVPTSARPRAGVGTGAGAGESPRKIAA